MTKNIFHVSLLFVAGLSACQQSQTMQPEQVSQPVEAGVEDVPNVFERSTPTAPKTTSSGTSASMHADVVEVLEDGQYEIAEVKVQGVSKWIITRAMGLQVGDHVDLTPGLTKTDYYNTALQRKFDEVMLVSELKVVHHDGAKLAAEPVESVVREAVAADALTVADLLANAGNLENQRVKVVGYVTKVNANIMKRNWIHLSDQQMNGNDLVLTSEKVVPVGHRMVFEGTLKRNLDFGAGYFFDVLVESAVLQ